MSSHISSQPVILSYLVYISLLYDKMLEIKKYKGLQFALQHNI